MQAKHFGMRIHFAILFLVIISQQVLSQDIKSPKEYFGYEVGEKFTRHHDMLGYFKLVADQSPRVVLWEYGTTYEGRPLIVAAVGSKKNIDRLDEIRTNNLKRAGLVEGTPSDDKTTILWMSYNVHGNEANGMEAAIVTLYQLAAGEGLADEWLKNTVILIDPCLNPDGRERYVNFYYQYGNNPPNPDPWSKEHREPWPGGRSNHYLFDLNRDWAWLSQKESRERNQEYNRWMPHVHMDFHEQAIDDPYYFLPAAEPYHKVITGWQRDFQVVIGKNIATYFDKEGWLYFTGERFDLFYPSYGDTYPTYNGAIGMTYEKGGSGRAGLKVTTSIGDELSLEDRVLHHVAAGLATIEICSKNAEKLATEFSGYHREALRNPYGAYKTYVIKPSDKNNNLKRLASLLDQHLIRYGTVAQGRNSRGFSYFENDDRNLRIEPGDLVISTFQPKSRLVTALLEPKAVLPDSMTYDITAWSLPYAYGLESFALTTRIDPDRNWEVKKSLAPNDSRSVYSFLVPYNSLDHVRFLSEAHQQNITVRVARKPFRQEGKAYNPGTLIITKRNNEHIDNFEKTIMELANKAGVTLVASATGWMDEGPDLGSDNVTHIKSPKVAVIGGQQTSSLSFGTIWHFFEEDIAYPISVLDTDYIPYVDFSDYQVLVVPDGYYRIFDESMVEALQSWVQKGGRLILIGNAINSFSGKEDFELKSYRTDDERLLAESSQSQRKEKNLTRAYLSTERDGISAYITGAIFRVQSDPTHPLGYGVGHQYFTLKNSSRRYALMDHGCNVGVINDSEPLSGFAGVNAKENIGNSLVYGVREMGRGAVIYFVDDPLFRSFWENGKLLFSNAVFMGGE